MHSQIDLKRFIQTKNHFQERVAYNVTSLQMTKRQTVIPASVMCEVLMHVKGANLHE